MTIAPIVRRVRVKAAPERAFDLFVNNMERWWPASHHIGEAPFEAIVVEARVGGRWFERDAAGVECQWGKVLDFSPPSRLLLAWQLDSQFTFDPAFVTEVEIAFEPAVDGGTEVTLTHRDLERFGSDARRIAGLLDGGWPEIVAAFGDFADQPPHKERAA